LNSAVLRSTIRYNDLLGTSIMGIKETVVYCSIVVILSTIAVMGYGWLVA